VSGCLACLERVSLAGVEPPLSAPLDIGFDYTRSLGPVLSRFMTALGEHRILGVRGSDGRVLAPPVEYDPVTYAPLSDLVEVGPSGVVTSWTWVSRPVPGQPFDRPFGFALIRLDGADTAMLHAIDAPHESLRTGMRVRARWASDPVGSIRDILCFSPVAEAPPTEAPPTEAASTEAAPTEAAPTEAPPPRETVTMTTTPVRLSYDHMVSPEESQYLRGLAEGKVFGQRCPECGKVYVPPRGACPTDGVPTSEQVELPDTGTVTTFCVVNVPFLGQRVKPPYVAAHVLLDGADIPLQHLILGCPPGEVRMGMRVRAAWRPREEWGPTPQNIDHFAPTGDPDAPFESYAHHL